MNDNPYGSKTIEEATDEAIEYIKKRKSGEIKSFKTEWKQLDNETLNGFEEGTLNLIAGLSGSGKTLLMANLEDRIMSNNDVDMISVNFNFEMLSKNLIIRKLSSRSNLSMRDILSASERLLTDKEILEIEEEAKEIKKQNVLYFDTPKTINKMAETIGWVWDKYKKPMLMFLDHSILVQKSAHHNTTTDMLYELGQFWNIIKKQYPITAFIASQLNREIESSDRKKVPTMHYPQKGDFSYSDGLYMSADMVIVSHIPYMLNLQFYGPQRLPCTQEDVYWHILKNRNNEANKVIRMKADFKNMKIIERNDS